MFIEITSDVVDKAEAGDKECIEALEKLAIAYRYGKHVVCYNLKDKQKISKMKSLQPNTRDIYKKIGERLQDYHSLGRLLVYKTFLTTKKISSKVGDIIYVNPQINGTFELYEESHLLAENLIDIDFFNFCVAYHKKKNPALNFNTCYFPLMGGGMTTDKVYEKEISLKQHFCLAILDSDKKYDGCNVGSTASNFCMSTKSYDPFNCTFYIMKKVREVENLIPFSILSKCGIKEIKRVFDANSVLKDTKNVDFSLFDMKKGLEGYKMDVDEYNYWSTNLAIYPVLKSKLTKSKVKKSPKIISGFGRDILKKLMSCAKIKQSLTDGSFSLTVNQEVEWTAIGKIIFEWCCADKPIRV